MTRKNSNGKLDRVGSRLIKSSVLSEKEASNISLSPFLLARVRSRVASEAHEGGSSIWGNLRLISRRAIPAMGLAAAFSLGLFLYTGNKSGNSTFSVDAYLGTSESGIDSLVFAEKRPLTTEEVLATIVSRDEREPAK